MRSPPTWVALAVAMIGVVPVAGAEVAVELSGCGEVSLAELARLVTVEVGTEKIARAIASCHDGEVRITVGARSQTIDLAAWPASARPRRIALGIAELLQSSPAPPSHAIHVAREKKTRRRALPLVRSSPAPTEAPEMSHLFQRILSTTILSNVLATVALAAPPSKPEAPLPPSRAPIAEAPRPDDRPHPVSWKLLLPGGSATRREVTDAQITLMTRLLDNTAAGDPERADLLFRLGELHADQGTSYAGVTLELDEKTFLLKQRGDTRSVQRLLEKRTETQRLADRSLASAIERFREVADHPDRFPDYARTDELLFRLASLLNQTGHDDAALGYQKRLIKNHPTSRFIADALLAFAERQFDRGDVASALALYEKVQAFPSSPLFAYAKYKAGWCLLNLGEHAKALENFIAVIELSRGAHRGGRIALEREAQKDTVRVFALIGQTERAWPLFQRIGGDHAEAMLEQLAELKNAQGKFADAKILFHQLMALAPSSTKLCAWQFEVVRNSLSLTGAQPDSSTVNELLRLTKVWEQFNSSGIKSELVSECRINTSQTLRELAIAWHREAQKTALASSYESALSLYRLYLAHFKLEPEAYAMTFFLGELLYKMASLPNHPDFYCQAAPVYTEVVKRNSAPNAPYLRDAAYAAVLSWQSCLSDGKQAAATHENSGKGEALAAKKIPDNELKLLAAYETFLRFGNDPAERTRIQYREGYLFYEFDHFAEAIPLLREVARKRDAELSTVAADLLFDSFAALRDTRALDGAVSEFCVDALFTADHKFADRCGVIKASLLRQLAEQREREKHVREAAELYVELAEEYPNYSQIDEVLWNAALDFQKVKLVGRAIQSAEHLIALRPDSPLARKSIFLLGRAYQSIAAYDAAAQSYERFAKTWPNEKDAQAALITAAFFRRGLGQSEVAVKDTELFISNYGRSPGRDESTAAVAFAEGQIFEQQNDLGRQKNHWKNYLKEFSARGGIDRQIIAHVRLGELAWNGSCPVTPLLGACVSVERFAVAARGKARRWRSEASCGVAPKVTVHARDKKLVAEAQSHFKEALKLWEKSAPSLPNIFSKVGDENERKNRSSDLVSTVASVRMIEGDGQYEKFLAMAVPRDLDFAHSQTLAAKRFSAWMEQKTRALESARAIYSGVIGLKQAHFAIAASARVGQLFQDFSSQLLSTPLPSPPPALAGVDRKEWRANFEQSYCDGISDAIELVEDHAVSALKQCLASSTQLGWFDEWSALCEAELNRLRPREFPLAAEIRAQPGYTSAHR